MSKPVTVADAMRNLTAALSPTPPAPTEVTIVPLKLKGSAEVIKFWLSIAVLLQLRTLIVWGFLATFFPGLGATWFMVMFGLWAVRHALPPKIQQTIDAIVAQRK